MQSTLEPTMSLLMLSIASSALTALGQNPHPDNQQFGIDKPMAKFNIDLLILLKQKTSSNLTTEEAILIEQLIHDLQLKYIDTK